MAATKEEPRPKTNDGKNEFASKDGHAPAHESFTSVLHKCVLPPPLLASLLPPPPLPPPALGGAAARTGCGLHNAPSKIMFMASTFPRANTH